MGVVQSEVNMVFSVRHGQFGAAISQLLAIAVAGGVISRTHDVCPLSTEFPGRRGFCERNYVGNPMAVKCKARGTAPIVYEMRKGRIQHLNSCHSSALSKCTTSRQYVWSRKRFAEEGVDATGDSQHR